MRVSLIMLSFVALPGSVVDIVDAKWDFKDTFSSYFFGRNNDRNVYNYADPDQTPPRSIGSSQPAPLAQRLGARSQHDEPEPLLLEEKQYNISVIAACQNAIKPLKSVVNPSGMVACYNIPFFDESSGKFVADIRIYQVSDPRDDFAVIQSSEYTLEVSIPQATLSSPQHLSAEDVTDSDLSMLHGFQHVGQLNPEIMLDNLSLEHLRILLIPNITIFAPTSKEPVDTTTTLSSDVLSYLAGFFTQHTPSDAPYTSSFPSSSSSANSIHPMNITFSDVTSQLPKLLDSTTTFVLPGTTLGVFPLGLVITGVWTLLFVGIVGWGTLERWKFKKHYRSRIEMARVRASGIR